MIEQEIDCKGVKLDNKTFAVPTCTAAMHIFQILQVRQFLRRFLSRAFTLCVHGRDNKVIIKQKQKNINKIDIFKLVQEKFDNSIQIRA